MFKHNDDDDVMNEIKMKKKWFIKMVAFIYIDVYVSCVYGNPWPQK